MAEDTRPANVHYKRTRDDGTDLYGYGVWMERQAQYQAPLDPEARRLTGCHTEFATRPIGTMTRQAAVQRARKLWGYVRVAE